MKKGKHCCNPIEYASLLMRYFLGALLLVLGVGMLVSYTATVDFMMSVADKSTYIPQILAQIVAYTWPVLATLIGLSLLTKFFKHWAILALVVYLLVFTIAHLWAGDQIGAIWDVMFVMYLGIMKGLHGMSCTCEK